MAVAAADIPKNNTLVDVSFLLGQSQVYTVTLLISEQWYGQTSTHDGLCTHAAVRYL